MNRLCHGTVVLIASVAALSCGDPTGDLRGDPESLSAEPSSLFIVQGATEQVLIRAVDEQGNELAVPVTNIVVNPAGVVDVAVDNTYLIGTDTTAPGAIPSTRTRLTVTGQSRASGSIQVTAGGLTLDIPVRVLPVATGFDATFSSQAPALAEPVTVTAPAGFTFTDSSAVSFGAGPTPIVTAVSGNTLTFLPGPNTTGKATLTEVVPAYAPALSLEFTTIDTIATPVIDSLDATFSTTTPTSGQQVTMTAPGGFVFQPTAAVTVGGATAIVNSRALDGTSITFQVVPSSVGAVVVDSTFLTSLPQFPLSLAARDTILAGPVTTLPGTASTATAPVVPLPAVGAAAAAFDAPDFAATVDHFYRIDVAEAGDYVITFDWDLGSDIDLLLCSDVACTAVDPQAATGAHPEVGTYSLVPGTYYIWANDFGGDAAGAQIRVTIAR